MRIKWGCLSVVASVILIFNSSCAKADDGKSPLAGLKNVAVVVGSLPDEITKAKITAADIQSEIIQKIKGLGLDVLYPFSLWPWGTPMSAEITSDLNSDTKDYSICCSLCLKVFSLDQKTGKPVTTWIWQKNRFATCQAEQINSTVKKCLTDCLDCFGREFAAANPKKEKNAGGQNMLTGQIKHITIEGGFYGIVGDDGQKYDPVNLANEFKKDGLRVRFAAKEKEGVASFHMWGKIVEIVNIEVAGKEADTAVTLQWLGHAAFRICHKDDVVYIDPWKLKEGANDATVVLVSHSHSDHYSPDDLQKIWTANTKLIASSDVVAKEGKGQTIKPGQTIEAGSVKITGVAAYNPAKQFHPKSNNWLGFVIEIDSVRIYYAGDTDIVDEMKSLKNIDVALLPVGGKYTMDTNEAAQAVKFIRPKQAIPCHFGEVVGGESDAMRFAEAADCDVLLIKPGEIVMLKE